MSTTIGGRGSRKATYGRVLASVRIKCPDEYGEIGTVREGRSDATARGSFFLSIGQNTSINLLKGGTENTQGEEEKKGAGCQKRP